MTAPTRQVTQRRREGRASFMRFQALVGARDDATEGAYHHPVG